MSGAVFSSRELYLARSALGLRDRERRRSYRNRFCLYDGCDDHDLWMGMVERGLARADRQFWPKMSTFWLTREGAEASLEPGETLDPEDFPTPAARLAAARDPDHDGRR